MHVLKQELLILVHQQIYILETLNLITSEHFLKGHPAVWFKCIILFVPLSFFTGEDNVGEVKMKQYGNLVYLLFSTYWCAFAEGQKMFLPMRAWIKMRFMIILISYGNPKVLRSFPVVYFIIWRQFLNSSKDVYNTAE